MSQPPTAEVVGFLAKQNREQTLTPEWLLEWSRRWEKIDPAKSLVAYNAYCGWKKDRDELRELLKGDLPCT